MQWDGSELSANDIIKWAGKHSHSQGSKVYGKDKNVFSLTTLFFEHSLGKNFASPSDWIIKDDSNFITVESAAGFDVRYHGYSSDPVEEAARGLDHMLELQKDVENRWGRLPDPANGAEVSRYIREVVLCATDELHEVLAEVNWKPWKESVGIKNLDNYREELADVMHFILDLYLAAGLTGHNIVYDYVAKHDTNVVRTQSEEYKNG